jgi:molybdopterin molybdotransferase
MTMGETYDNQLKKVAPATVEKLVRELLAPWTRKKAASDKVPLPKSLGCVLSQDVVADRDGPPFNRAAMDGLAVSSADWRRGRRSFRSLGVLAAGDPIPEVLTLDDDLVAPAIGVEIMTGAGVPDQFDVLLRYEDLRAVDNDFEFIGKDKGLCAGANIHPRGSDYRAGQVVLAAGSVITVPSLAVLASEGCDPVTVRKRPTFHIVSTGSELVPVKSKPLPHQIRSSNLMVLAAQLEAWNLCDCKLCWAGDNREDLRQRLNQGLSEASVLIIVGGISKGKYDYVPSLLQSLDVEIAVHGVTQRPGQPLLVGWGQRRQLVLGLPGNPVSCLVGLRRYLIPALLEHAGPLSIAIREQPPPTPINTRFIGVRIDRETGVGELVQGNGSGDFHHLTAADGFIEVPPGNLAPDAKFDFYPWRGPL